MSSALTYSEIRRRTARTASEVLARGEAPPGAVRAAFAEGNSCLELVRAMPGMAERLDGLACGAGCSWCCRQVVGVSEAELTVVLDAVASLPAKARKAVAAAATKAAKKGKGLDQRQWWAAGILCPLLDEAGLCRVHAARPLPCRAHNSADAGACRRAAEGEAVPTPVLAAQQGVWANAQLGLLDALAGAGLPTEMLNLALAVNQRLNR